jgi:hypothetical protein
MHNVMTPFKQSGLFQPHRKTGKYIKYIKHIKYIKYIKYIKTPTSLGCQIFISQLQKCVSILVEKIRAKIFSLTKTFIEVFGSWLGSAQVMVLCGTRF